MKTTKAVPPQIHGHIANNTLGVVTKSSAYRDVILQKVKQKYTESIPSFSKRIEQRFAVDTLVQTQCRLCGLKDKLCCKIFDTNSTLSALINTYMPITVKENDSLPLNVCMECLGILQSIDDLAYRCYLVEACLLQHYNDYKDTSIFLDPPPKDDDEEPYVPLHLKLPAVDETLHPAKSLGFPLRRKGSYIHNHYYNEHDKFTAFQEAAATRNQVTTSKVSPPEVVKNNLKANLHKILLGGGGTNVKPSLPTLAPPTPQYVAEPDTVDLTHDHGYSTLASSLGLTTGGSKNVKILPKPPVSSQNLSTNQMQNIATAALAELNKNPTADNTLLNLSQILNNQGTDLDEPVFLILVNDEEKNELAPQTEFNLTTEVKANVPVSNASGVQVLTVEDNRSAQNTQFLETEPVSNLENDSDDDCQFVSEISMEDVETDTGKDSANQAGELSQATQIDPGVNPDDELVKFSESLQTEQIKRWFTIQILKTSSENDKDKDKETDNTDEADSDGVMLVTYVVYYSKINGRLVPHHFSLMNDNFSDVTRRRAYSIISTMLKEEKNRVLAVLESQKKNPPKASKQSLARVPPKKPFRTTCCYCNETMKESDLTQHTIKNHMVRCKECRIFFTSKEELIGHECEAHGKTSVECETCQKKFFEEEDKFFCSHVFNCSTCKKQFSNWPEFIHHEKIHFNAVALKFMRDFTLDFGRSMTNKNPENEKVLNFTCQTCGKKFENQVEMEICDHTYECKLCRNQFSNYPLFVTHGCISNPDLLKIVGKKKNQKKVIIQCALCHASFDGQKMYLGHYYSCMLKHGIQVDLTEEIKSLQTNSPVTCIFCEESFKSIFIFELHYSQCYKLHSTECEDCEEIIPIHKKGSHLLFCNTNTLCDYCGATFLTKKLYRLHLRQQLDGSTICTASGEAKEFSYNGYISEGFNPSNCHICGKVFVSWPTLDRHVKSVHLGLDKSCPLCGEKFQKHNSITMFLRHRKSHSSEEMKDVSVGDTYGSCQCTYCEKWFSSKLLKLIHEVYYHQKPLHKCVRCEIEFVSLMNLRSHETKCKAKQKDKSVYTCEHCGEAFSKAILYHRHVDTHDITYTCEECGKTFKKKTNLAKHKEVAHSNSPTICDVCGREFSCEKYCKIHKRNLHGDQKFLCQVCGKTFHNKKRLTLHASVHSGLKPHKCRYCDKYFRTQSIRNIHEDKHKNDFRYTCNYCQAKFSRFINLYVHKRKIHADKCTYQCKQCGCGYNDAEFYNNHIKTCGGKRKRMGKERSLYCPYCDKTFASSRLLKAHYTPATDSGILVCSNFSCRKRFDCECSLRLHERVHASDKFPCKLCGEAFLGMKQLELHSQLKHNETFAFHCSYCGRGYQFEKFLKKHVKYCNESLQQLAYTPNKSKKPIVRCESCGKIFGKFKDLRVHMTIVHGSETYKDYECLICDSKYDSYIQLSKHSKHHFKDPTNPGSYCCPKCKIQTSDWEVMMNHVCGSGLPKQGDICRFSPDTRIPTGWVNTKKKSTQGQTSSLNSRKATSQIYRPGNSQYDSDDDYTPSGSISSYSKSPRGGKYGSSSSSRLNQKSRASSQSYDNRIYLQQKEEYVEDREDYMVDKDEYISDEEMPPHPAVSEDANLIYHCSFCSSNFDHITTLQNHLTADHNLSLNSLEFQLVE